MVTAKAAISLAVWRPQCHINSVTAFTKHYHYNNNNINNNNNHGDVSYQDKPLQEFTVFI